MNQTLQVSVIVCSYNRATYIAEAMQSLYDQTLDKNRYEVIVVDNNSTDNTREVCLEFISRHTNANFYYFEEKRQGASYARNNGAAKAQSPLLCFMDDDAIAAKDYLQRIVDFFQHHPNAAGLGGRIIPRYIPYEPSWMSYYVSSLVGNFDYSPTPTVFQPGKYPLESNMVIYKADFDTIKGFSTELPGVVGTLRIGGEGKDFFLRLQALGKAIYYDPAIVVWHVVEVKKLTKEYMYRVASGIGRGERIRILKQGKLAFRKKEIEYLFKLAASILIGIKYCLQGNFSKAMPVIQFRIDALKGLWEK